MTKKSTSIILKCIGVLILAAFLIIGLISCDKKIPSISYLDEPADSDTADSPVDSDSGKDTSGESESDSESVSFEDDDDEGNWTPFY